MTRSSTSLPVLVDRRVGLRDDVALLFPGRQVPGVGLGLDLIAFFAFLSLALLACRARRR